MPVSDHLAFPLLRAFGRLEYQLKQRSGFLRADRYGNAMVDWRAVNAAVAALPGRGLQTHLSENTLDKVLGGGRNRPKVQVVEEVHGRSVAHFAVRDLGPDDACALVEAAKRVRNNLFHGGKEDPGEQPFDGDDDQWGEAALDVSQALLDLVERGVFGPADC